MSSDTIDQPLYGEARRQLQICNACRYCEGYCSAFPAITRLRAFADADITQIANLCHNCRGCHYSCQYTEPHEFALNLPRALAEVRTDSWQQYAWPRPLARVFLKHAWATVAATVLGFAALFLAARLPGASQGGDGFYSILPHNLMVVIFAPAFVMPLLGMAIGLRRFWRDVGGERVGLRQLLGAFGQAARMKNLSGGHGDGCNFENGERHGHARRLAHQAIMYGFLLCFAATSAGTILHYGFDVPAPYPLVSVPKLLGVVGGILLGCGCVWMFLLKQRSDAGLADPATGKAENAFIVLLGFVAFSGLALYAFGAFTFMPVLLAVHLGAVLAFFLLTPYTKMAHGFFRLAALVRDMQQRQRD